jgi:hypothetical protein
MHVNEHERQYNVSIVTEQPVVRKDTDVNAHKRLSNITPRRKLK